MEDTALCTVTGEADRESEATSARETRGEVTSGTMEEILVSGETAKGMADETAVEKVGETAEEKAGVETQGAEEYAITGDDAMKETVGEFPDSLTITGDMSAKLAFVSSEGGEIEEVSNTGMLLRSLLVMVTMSPRVRESASSLLMREGSQHLMSIQIPLSASLSELATGLVSSRASSGPERVIRDRRRAVILVV